MQGTQETWVLSLDGEDALEEETATHSSILAWKIPCTKEPGGLQSMEPQAVEHVPFLFRSDQSLSRVRLFETP